MLKIIIICVFVVAIECGFLDFTDLGEPFSLLWSAPVLHKDFSECKIDANRNGVCMKEAKCKLTGGVSHGRCGILFTCCSHENICTKTLDDKQGYVYSDNINPATTKCRYTIKLRNKHVCQVRLDFERFILATATSLKTEDNSILYSCFTDRLRITPNHYGIPTLCGNNANQHVYVHVNQSEDNINAISLEIDITNRLNDAVLPKPEWKIKFTQLECPLKKHKLDISKFKEVDEVANDFNLLAPQGIIQYHTERSGEIMSFGNFDVNYPFFEYYVIGFKRYRNVCGIRFTVTELNLPKYQSGDCAHYLYTPDQYNVNVGYLSDSSGAICSGVKEFSSFAPGPFHLYFKAMTTVPLVEGNQGFKLKYDMLSTGTCFN